MQYVQLDNFNGNINLVCKDDGSGEVLVFDNLKEAEDTLEGNCQDGIVVPLTDIVKLLRTFSLIPYSEFGNLINDILDGHT